MSIKHDRRLIARLGGPAQLARMLGYEGHGGMRRVCNWLRRGIPAAVRLKRPDLFVPKP